MRKLIVAALAASILAGNLTACATTVRGKPDFTGVRGVCKLATLKCYYHNVARGETEASGPLAILGIGYKKLWIEYDGIVSVGVDASKVSIDGPYDGGVVRVHVPDAEVLSYTLDETTIGEPLTDQGWFTVITTEEKTAAVAKAQADMEQTAAENTSILAQAHERAKKVIESYVTNTGAIIGETYTVEWV